MKNVVIATVATLIFSLGVQTFAFEPYVNGKRTLALEDQNGKIVVEAGIVKRVSDTETLKTWLQAKIFELQVLLAAMPKEECAK